MSINALRSIITASGGTPTQYNHVHLLRELITTLGGTPTNYGIVPLLRQLVTTAGGTPATYNPTYLVRQFIEALGGIPASYQDDSLWARALAIITSHFPDFPLVADFDDQEYWQAGAEVADLDDLSGYAFTRTGIQGAVDADGSVDWFAANVPALNSRGFHAYGALENFVLHSQDFSQIAEGLWSISGITSVVANQVAAPDGTTTMDRLNFSTTSQAHLFFSEGSERAHPNPFTDSIFIKHDGYSWPRWNMIIAADATHYASYDLITGTCTTTNSSIVEPFLIDCGNGIFRLVAIWKVDGVGFTCVPVAKQQTWVSGGTARVPSFLAADGYGLAWQAQSIDGYHPDGGPLIATGATTMTIGASGLVLGAPNDDYDATYVFEDDTEQVIPVTIADGTFEHPVFGALNKGVVSRVVLEAS